MDTPENFEAIGQDRRSGGADGTTTPFIRFA